MYYMQVERASETQPCNPASVKDYPAQPYNVMVHYVYIPLVCTKKAIPEDVILTYRTKDVHPSRHSAAKAW